VRTAAAHVRNKTLSQLPRQPSPRSHPKLHHPPPRFRSNSIARLREPTTHLTALPAAPATAASMVFEVSTPPRPSSSCPSLLIDAQRFLSVPDGFFGGPIAIAGDDDLRGQLGVDAERGLPPIAVCGAVRRRRHGLQRQDAGLALASLPCPLGFCGGGLTGSFALGDLYLDLCREGEPGEFCGGAGHGGQAGRQRARHAH
jgi:hypothetical protein